jgi:hypothetical protein
MKTLKTAEELFSKYELIVPLQDEDGNDIEGQTQETDCMDYDNFLKALTEHDKEIKDLIDEMMGELKLKQEKTSIRIVYSRYDAKIEALTELKEKL